MRACLSLIAFFALFCIRSVLAGSSGVPLPYQVDETNAERVVDARQWLLDAERDTLEWWARLTGNSTDGASAVRHNVQEVLAAQETVQAAGPSTSGSSKTGQQSSKTAKTAGDVNNPRPNIIVVIVDDMDKEMGSLEFMPKVKKLLREQGTEFENHFVTSSVCCPSRMSLLTGMFAWVDCASETTLYRFATGSVDISFVNSTDLSLADRHNTNFTDVVAPGGGWERYFDLGLTEISIPKFLHDAGYSTAFFGKLVNAYLPRNHFMTPPGWDIFDSLVNPWMYNFFQTVMSRNGDRMSFYPNIHQSDVISSKATQAIRDASAKKRTAKTQGVDKPFFLYVAPTACHTELHFKDRPFPDPPVPFHPAKFLQLLMGNMGDTGSFSGPGVGNLPNTPEMGFMPGVSVMTTEAIPAERHRDLYPDAKVPRTPNFNPDTQDKPGWIGQLPKITDKARLDKFDHWYRQRIRSLASVDDMVEEIVGTLEKEGELENTYIVFTSDNGWHLGLHRLGGGKLTAYEHDIRVPMVVRGPGVPKNVKSSDVTTHTDIAPTLLGLASLPIPAHFDGAPMPLKKTDGEKLEAFGVEYWSMLLDEESTKLVRDNNYKSVRYLSKSGRNYLYTVRCLEHERELYDLTKDPHELVNAVHNPAYAKLVDRLDALLEVLRACQGKECREPWKRYHPDGSVTSLDAAMDPKYDDKYRAIPKMRFRECGLTHDLYAEGISDVPGASVRVPDEDNRKVAKMTPVKDLVKEGWNEAPVEGSHGQDMKMPRARM